MLYDTSSMYDGVMGSDTSAQEFVQGQVNIAGKFDDQGRSLMVTNEKQGRPCLFYGAQMAGAHNLYPWESAFIYLPSNMGGMSPYPSFLTALNGLGSAEIDDALAEGNHDLAREIAKSMIAVVGNPTDPYDSTGGKMNPSQALRINGIRMIFPIEDTPFNCLVRACVPTKEEAALYKKLAGALGGVTVDHIPLVHKPYKISDVNDAFFAHIRDYLDDEKKYREAMNTKYQRTSKLTQTMRTVIDTDLTKFCLMLYQCVNQDIFHIAMPNDPQLKLWTAAAFPGGGAVLDKAQTRQYILCLASKLGVLPSNHYASFLDFRDDQETTKNGLVLRRELGLTAYWDAKDGMRSFGFDRDTGILEGTDNSGNAMKGTALGDMLDVAALIPKLGVGAHAEFIMEDGRDIIGRCVKAAQKGAIGYVY